MVRVIWGAQQADTCFWRWDFTLEIIQMYENHRVTDIWGRMGSEGLPSHGWSAHHILGGSGDGSQLPSETEGRLLWGLQASLAQPRALQRHHHWGVWVLASEPLAGTSAPLLPPPPVTWSLNLPVALLLRKHWPRGHLLFVPER